VALGAHVGEDGPGDGRGAEDIGVENTPQGDIVQDFEGSHDADTRVVDQNVDTTEALDRGGDCLVDAALIGDVEAFDAFRVLDKTIVGTRGVTERGDNVVATPRERKRSCEAEA
jgi:hypothetical protein